MKIIHYTEDRKFGFKVVKGGREGMLHNDQRALLRQVNQILQVIHGGKNKYRSNHFSA